MTEITKERRDAIRPEAIRAAAMALRDVDLIKGVDGYYERLARLALTAAAPHLALDAAEAKMGAAEIRGWEVLCEDGTWMLAIGREDRQCHIDEHRQAGLPPPVFRPLYAIKPVACGGCGTSDPESRCIGCLHDFYASPPSPAVPEGWKLVPVDPTDEMLAAVWSIHASNGKNIAAVCYDAMLSASPIPETPNE